MMNKNELISCFQDTLKRAHSNVLKDKTAESCSSKENEEVKVTKKVKMISKNKFKKIR